MFDTQSQLLVVMWCYLVRDDTMATIFLRWAANLDSVVPVMLSFRFCASAYPSEEAQCWQRGLAGIDPPQATANPCSCSFLFLPFPATSTRPIITFGLSICEGERVAKSHLASCFCSSLYLSKLYQYIYLCGYFNI